MGIKIIKKEQNGYKVIKDRKYDILSKIDIVNKINNKEFLFTAINRKEKTVTKFNDLLTTVFWNIEKDCIFLFEFEKYKELLRKNYELLKIVEHTSVNQNKISDEEKFNQWFEYYSGNKNEYPEFYKNEIFDEIKGMNKVNYIMNLFSIYEKFLKNLYEDATFVNNFNGNYIVNYYTGLKKDILDDEKNNYNISKIEKFQNLMIEIKRIVNEFKHAKDVKYDDMKKILNNNGLSSNELKEIFEMFMDVIGDWENICSQ